MVAALKWLRLLSEKDYIASPLLLYSKINNSTCFPKSDLVMSQEALVKDDPGLSERRGERNTSSHKRAKTARMGLGPQETVEHVWYQGAYWRMEGIAAKH